MTLSSTDGVSKSDKGLFICNSYFIHYIWYRINNIIQVM